MSAPLITPPPDRRRLRLVGRMRPDWLPRPTRAQERLRAGLAALRSQVREHPVRSGAIAVASALALLVLGAAFMRSPGDEIITAPVREGAFRVSIVETGTLQALRSITYASTIQSNQAKIVAMAPEGKLVQKGDLLLLFDAAPFEEEIRRSQAQLAQAQAEVQRAEEDYKLQTIQNREELATARQRVERSELELKDTQEGKGRLREVEAQAAVAEAERQLQKARGDLEDLKPLLKEGFITQQELDRAAQAVEKAREDLALALRRRDALMNFGRPLEVSEARSQALMTKESVKQLQSVAVSRLEQKSAAIAAAQSRVQEAASRLALAQQQLARTEIRADVPGIVVYRHVFFGAEPRKPQVGDQVWANQPLLILPDISRMVVETKVRETDVHKVDRNQKVEVRVDAYPDLRLHGRVTLVGTLAQEERERRGAKFFGVTVEVDESDQRLRPGMTARVEIHVEERARAVSVPLEAVFRKEGKAFCYVRERWTIRPREVVLGPSNEHFVVIEKGLRPGEQVCLRDPGAPRAEAAAPAS